MLNKLTTFNMRTLSFFSCCLLLLNIAGCSKDTLEPPDNSNAKKETPSAEKNYPLLFEQTIDCAALIAVNEQRLQGEMTADSQAFVWVGYTLGQANNYNSDGKLNANTQQAYAQATTKLFLQHGEGKEAINPAEYAGCIEQAKIYNPDTQMQTLFKKAKRISEDSNN